MKWSRDTVLLVGAMTCTGLLLGTLGRAGLGLLPSSSGEVTRPAAIEFDDLEEEALPADRRDDSPIARALDAWAHPDDPDTPRGVGGADDEALAAVPVEDVEALLEQGLDFATDRLDEPRYMFALGRASLIHGDEALAWDLLMAAADAGSSAAHAYLAHLTDETEDAEQLLEIAERGGFAPASAWLGELRSPPVAASNAAPRAAPPPSAAARPSADPDFAEFNQPELLRMFYTGQTEPLDDDIVFTLMYLDGFNETLEQAWYYTGDPRMKLEVDPMMSGLAARKLMSQQGTNQAMAHGFGVLQDLLGAMAGARESGASVAEEVSAVGQVMTSKYMPVDVLKKQAEQDATRLMLDFHQNPEIFRRVYRGMKAYLQR